jgi:MoaA/NifB/PqqE/SkfB family radical SAM enzyme
MNIMRVHQIEISSRCNLACRYCPHPKLGRAKADMRWEVFAAAIAWARELGGPELSFTGMGEALLHPEYAGFLRYARGRLPGVRQGYKDAKSDLRDVAAEAAWKECQGEDYGSY